MARRLRGARGEGGQATFSVVITIVVVILAAILLTRVSTTAESISKKASRISKTAVPIGVATQAVAGGNLDKTNSLAGSILTTAQPLQPKLDEIIRLAKDVDRLAASINGSAGTIDNTAKGINSTAAGAFETARSIDRGVQQINRNLDDTLAIVTAIKGDTGNILGQANLAHKEAACIDQALAALGGSSDGHCR